MIGYNGTHSWLLEYISKCKTGEIVIGHELMLQLDIFLTHFKNSNIKIELTDAHKKYCRQSLGRNACQ